MKDILKKLSLTTNISEHGNLLVEKEFQELSDIDLEKVSGAGFINATNCSNEKCNVTLNRGCTNDNCAADSLPPSGNP